MNSILVLICILLLLPAKQSAATGHEGALAQSPEVQAFIGEMVLRHQFDAEELTRLFGEVRIKQSILSAMERPAEAKPWHAYRPLFVEPKRISDFVPF